MPVQVRFLSAEILIASADLSAFAWAQLLGPSRAVVQFEGHGNFLLSKIIHAQIFPLVTQLLCCLLQMPRRRLWTKAKLLPKQPWQLLSLRWSRRILQRILQHRRPKRLPSQLQAMPRPLGKVETLLTRMDQGSGSTNCNKELNCSTLIHVPDQIYQLLCCIT